MNRRLYLLLSIICLILSGCAQDFGKQSGKSTLWRVKTPTNTVYLMGSVHVLPKSAYPLKPALDAAFRDSRHVVFEVAITKGNTEQVMKEAFNAGLYPKGEKLSAHLKPETLTMLKTLLPYYGIPLAKVEPMRPWLVADLLTSMFLARGGYSSDLGLDLHYLAAAEKAGKPTAGLEKVQAQTTPFRELSDSASDLYLREALAALPSMPIVFPKMVKAWREGDVSTLNSFINQSSEKLQQSVFTDRNNSWLPAIRKYLKGSENVLVIVGSGHLVGKTGIVEQLRRDGLVVEQL